MISVGGDDTSEIVGRRRNLRRKMDVFRKAETVRLISHRDKYLVAGDDLETVTLSDDGTAANAVWTVEIVEGKDAIRFRSSFGTYLSASTTPFLPGVTARKVVQTTPYYCDPATQWTPQRDGMQVKLRSFWGNFLRPNGGLPPWRNSITHDIYHRPKSKEKLLWEVQVVVKRTDENAPREGRLLCRLRSRSFSSPMPPPPSKPIVIRSQEFI